MGLLHPPYSAPSNLVPLTLVEPVSRLLLTQVRLRVALIKTREVEPLPVTRKTEAVVLA